MAGGGFPAFVEQVRLIDHHVHGAFHADGDEARFQNSLNEGNNEPLANPGDTYNTQIGLALICHGMPHRRTTGTGAPSLQNSRSAGA
jgi:hypothetical protein